MVGKVKKHKEDNGNETKIKAVGNPFRRWIKYPGVSLRHSSNSGISSWFCLKRGERKQPVGKYEMEPKAYGFCAFCAEKCQSWLSGDPALVIHQWFPTAITAQWHREAFTKHRQTILPWDKGSPQNVNAVSNPKKEKVMAQNSGLTLLSHLAWVSCNAPPIQKKLTTVCPCNVAVQSLQLQSLQYIIFHYFRPKFFRRI